MYIAYTPSVYQIPSLDTYLNDKTRVNSRNVLEIQGPSGSGKTHLLYSLLATCILPVDHFLGWGKAAFVFDMDGTFRLSRFCQILTVQLERYFPLLPVLPLVEKCLQHIHIFRPASSDQLDITLHSLHKFHGKLFPALELGMIAIHSIDAFYWLDRFKAEQARLSTSFSPKSTDYRNTASALHNLLLSYNATVVTTHWAFIESNPSAYASNNKLHRVEATPIDRLGISSTSLQALDRQSISKHHQLLLTAGKKAIVGDAKLQEIQVLVRTLDQTDHILFKMHLTHCGVIVQPDW